MVKQIFINYNSCPELDSQKIGTKKQGHVLRYVSLFFLFKWGHVLSYESLFFYSAILRYMSLFF